VCVEDKHASRKSLAQKSRRGVDYITKDGAQIIIMYATAASDPDWREVVGIIRLLLLSYQLAHMF
jgi:hypothetical protein